MQTKEFWVVRMTDRELFHDLSKDNQLKLLTRLEQVNVVGIPCLVGVIELDHVELDELRVAVQTIFGSRGFFYRVIERPKACRRALEKSRASQGEEISPGSPPWIVKQRLAKERLIPLGGATEEEILESLSPR